MPFNPARLSSDQGAGAWDNARVRSVGLHIKEFSLSVIDAWLRQSTIRSPESSRNTNGFQPLGGSHSPSPVRRRASRPHHPAQGQRSSTIPLRWARTEANRDRRQSRGIPAWRKTLQNSSRDQRLNLTASFVSARVDDDFVSAGRFRARHTNDFLAPGNRILDETPPDRSMKLPEPSPRRRKEHSIADRLLSLDRPPGEQRTAVPSRRIRRKRVGRCADRPQ
jgi:hypothetical protein